MLRMQEFQHGAAFSAGNDQAIQRLQVRSAAYEDGIGSYPLEYLGMRFKIALERQHPDFLHYQPRVCNSSDSCSLEISMPGMAIPSSSLASSSLAGSL